MNLTHLLKALAVIGLFVLAACGPTTNSGSPGGGGGFSGGGGGNSGGGGGSSGGGGGGIGSQPAANCGPRCEGYAMFCGASQEDAKTQCDSFCQSPPSEDEFQCLLTLPCGESGSCEQPTNECNDGAKRCNVLTAERCEQGKWVEEEKCLSSCANGACTTGGEGCPINKNSLKVQFPYVSLSPPTTVDVAGYCLKDNTEGYSGATIVRIFEDRMNSSPAVEELTSAFNFIEVKIGQRIPTSSDLASLSTKTGIPAARFNNASTLHVPTDSKLEFVGYSLPVGVSATMFMPSSTAEDGFIRFSSAVKSSVETVLNDLDGGITFDITLGTDGISPPPRYKYRIKLDDQGLVQVMSISKL
jgi:hypothetical protein